MDLNVELQKILDNNECFVHFLDFLDANKCSESVFFWRDCELYSSLFQDLSREKQKGNEAECKRIERSIEAKASDIYEIYFSEHSPYMINIEGKISKDITEKFKRGDKPTPDLFKKAQKAIFSLMKFDSYPRFEQSPYYANMLRTIEQKDPSRFAALNFTAKIAKTEATSSPKKEKQQESFELATIGKSHGLNKIINKMKSTKIKVPKPHLSFTSNQSAPYSSEQALETTYNPREIVLSSKEIAEMKVFIDQSVTKLVGMENEGKVDLTLLLSDQDCDKLNHNFKTEAGRRYFADVLNRLRSSKPISSAGFEILWRLTKVALINSDYYNDYCSAKMLMHMAATYFREVSGVRDYVYTRLKSIELWHKTRYWEFALYDAVANERDKVKISLKEWNKLSPEDRADRVASERGIFFGQLGSFAMHMLSVGLDVDSVRAFISKQCLVNALSEDQRDTLIGALPNMMHAVEESEKERSKIVDLNITSPMPNKKPSVMENPIQEKKEQLIKKKSAFMKQEQMFDTLISLCDELKAPAWEERNIQITEQMINQGFDELRKMLDLKQKELLQNLREKSQEIMEGLANNAKEMTEKKKKTIEAISGIDYMLTLEDPENFAAAVQESEKKLDEHLLNALKDKPNQLIVNDYSFYISFERIKNEIEHLHTNDKMSIARWKIKEYSTSVSREVSSLFRLHGFNWRLVLHPHSSPEKISLYLEFMDSTTAVSWQLSVKFILRLVNQKNILTSKSSDVITYAFGVDSKKSGYSEFISNEELESEDSGWIFNDSVLFEVELLELDIIEENATENV